MPEAMTAATAMTPPDEPRCVSIADLVGSRIMLADGRRIGRVVDVEVSRSAGYLVTALLYGRYGWLYRLHVLQPLAQKVGVSVKPHRVPWRAVAHLEVGAVTLRHRRLLNKREATT